SGGVAVDDLDGDGVRDLLVAQASAPAGVELIRGDGLGGFLTPIFLDVGQAASAVAVSDLQADGRPDLLLASANWIASVVEQDSAGNFPDRRPFGSTTEIDRLFPVDVNGDGTTDLVISGLSGAAALLNADGPLEELGSGLPGAQGVPALGALGTLAPGSPLSVRVHEIPASATVTLV